MELGKDPVLPLSLQKLKTQQLKGEGVLAERRHSLKRLEQK